MPTPSSGSAAPVREADRPVRRRTHVLLFDDAHRTLEAVKALRADGFHVEEVHGPMPLHGIDEALGLRETRLGWGTLVGGMLGLTIAVSFQLWTHMQSWQLNIGGKTNSSLPALVPVSFELTVLLAAFATVGGLLIRSRLTRPGPVAAHRLPDPRVTDDRFAVLVVEEGGDFAPARYEALCERLGPVERKDSWRIQ